MIKFYYLLKVTVPLSPLPSGTVIVTLQVKELVGDFGGLKMIMQKALCTIPTVALPPEMITTIYEMGKRRTAIGY